MNKAIKNFKARRLIPKGGNGLVVDEESNPWQSTPLNFQELAAARNQLTMPDGKYRLSDLFPVPGYPIVDRLLALLRPETRSRQDRERDNERGRRNAEIQLRLIERARSFEAFNNFLNLTVPSTYVEQIAGQRLPLPTKLIIDFASAPLSTLMRRGVTKGIQMLGRRALVGSESFPAALTNSEPLIARGSRFVEKTGPLDEMDRILAFNEAKQRAYDNVMSPVYDLRYRRLGFNQREILELRDLDLNTLNRTTLDKNTLDIFSKDLGVTRNAPYLDRLYGTGYPEVDLNLDRLNLLYTNPYPLLLSAEHEVGGHAVTRGLLSDMENDIRNLYRGGNDLPQALEEYYRFLRENPTLVKRSQVHLNILPSVKENAGNYYRDFEEIHARYKSIESQVRDQLRKETPWLEYLNPKEFDKQCNNRIMDIIRNDYLNHLGAADIREFWNLESNSLNDYIQQTFKKGGKFLNNFKLNETVKNSKCSNISYR